MAFAFPMGAQFRTSGFGPKAIFLSLLELAIRGWVLGYLKLFHCIRFRGLHNVPDEGPALVVSNHLSLYDPAAVGIPHSKRRVRFMAYHLYFKIPLAGAVMRGLGAFPIDSAKADRSAYEASLRVLREDRDMIVMFPEGARTRSRALNPLKVGAARLALASEAWIVPTAILGPERSWPTDRVMPRLFVPFIVKFYPPLRVELPASRADREDAIAEVNRHLETIWRRRIRAQERLFLRRGKHARYTA